MLSPATTVQQAIDWASEQLAQAPCVEQPQADAQRLLAHALGVSRSALLARDAITLGERCAAQFVSDVARRCGGEPFAYIVGQRDFWTLTLHVTPEVLVPRPETELLVERALHHGGDRAALDLADLGTGSGCIALALGSERPHWRVTATDRSAAALAVARDNALRLGISNVQFRCGDWCAALDHGRYALLVSNPPYIGSNEPELDSPALRHEPGEALTPGADGLAALRTLCEQAPAHLLPGGWLLLEHGATQAPAVRALLVAKGFAHVTSYRDLGGIERVTEGSWRT